MNSMTNFQLMRKEIEEDLYFPKGAEKSTVYKLGKVGLAIYFSNIMLTPPLSPNDIKDFTISRGEAISYTECVIPSIWEKQLASLEKNKEQLTTIIKALKKSIEWEKYDMQEPSKAIIQNTLDFITICPDDDLLESVSIFPRVNGTVLLKWNDKFRIATVNIGTKNFSFAILPKDGRAMTNGEFKIDKENTIEGFYNKL